jgi:hypothetical protein
MSSVYKDRKSPIFGMIMFVIVLSVLLAAIFGVFVIDLSTTGTVETETYVTSIATGVLYDVKHLGFSS